MSKPPADAYRAIFMDAVAPFMYVILALAAGGIVSQGWPKELMDWFIVGFFLIFSIVVVTSMGKYTKKKEWFTVVDTESGDVKYGIWAGKQLTFWFVIAHVAFIFMFIAGLVNN